MRKRLSFVFLLAVFLIPSSTKGLTLEQKIGQMIIGGFKGAVLDEELKKLIIEYNIGGFNLLERNIKDREQIKKLNNDIQDLAKSKELPPLFIAVDQEGGPINRVKFLKEKTPQSRVKNQIQAKKIAENRGEELASLGFNMVFSPVLDYANDKKSYLYARVFRTSEKNAPVFSKAMIEGYLIKNIIPVPKHFPGYGNIKADPHRSSSAKVALKEYQKNLKIFSEILKTTKPEFLMGAHITIVGLDKNPATFSKKISSDTLRRKLGFQGILISDDLEMASALSKKDIGEAAVLAIKAGNDMLISTKNPEYLPKIINAIKKTVENGEITEERINESVSKILETKQKYLGYQLDSNESKP